ncbi:glycosyltransferase family 2 protein [Bradyrhizobium sp. S69]|uniref:glycosyltransferase family 2 protein n=1 Tax=Bradyrhizobium sp. S69 TaxID=1641856 RepID=UPI00131AE2D7|nr:glycosyltransferase family 2 protein [Bradyrhizobium sp. S69]
MTAVLSSPQNLAGGGETADVDPPEVSIIILNWNKSDLTLRCLENVKRHTRSVSFEILVVDNGSNSFELATLKKGLDQSATLISLSQNMFFGEGNNIAAEAARGRFLLFLNNDVTIDDIINDLIVQFKTCFSAGAVGPKFLYPSGVLQEAGAFLLPNGMSLRGGQQNLKVDPHFEYGSHIVDYCSAACLLVERDSFFKVGGFDPLFDPGYYEDCDLCFRLRAMGLYTYYASEIVVIHEENVTSSALWGGEEINQIVAKNRSLFLNRWRYYLEGRIGNPVTIVDPLPSFEQSEMPPVTTRSGKILMQSTTILQISAQCSAMFRIADALQNKYSITFAVPEVCSALRVCALGRHFGVQLRDATLVRQSTQGTPEYHFSLSFSDHSLVGGAQKLNHDTLKSIYKLL